MKTATIGDLQRAIENIPGSDLLGSLISQFKCPAGATIYPPIDSFLSTLTLDPCKGASPKLSLPTIPDIPVSWNWMEVLGEAFMFGIKQIISAVLVALMRKAAELFSTDLCKLSGNLFRGAVDGGLEGVISELICDDPRPGDTQDKINQKVLEAVVRVREAQKIIRLLLVFYPFQLLNVRSRLLWLEEQTKTS